MPDLRFPLSGNVSQTINPWTWHIPYAGNPLGLVNITPGNAGNPAAEMKILDEAGTYGKQLGQTGDRLKILVGKAEAAGVFSPAEKKTVAAFRAQLEHIERIKQAPR
jgi:hypothetical protein